MLSPHTPHMRATRDVVKSSCRACVLFLSNELAHFERVALAAPGPVWVARGLRELRCRRCTCLNMHLQPCTKIPAHAALLTTDVPRVFLLSDKHAKRAAGWNYSHSISTASSSSNSSPALVAAASRCRLLGSESTSQPATAPCGAAACCQASQRTRSILFTENLPPQRMRRRTCGG